MDFVTIDLFGITWVRPNNLLTNLIVGIAGLILAYQIHRRNTQKDPYLYLWAGFFLFVGLGGAIGGFAHAFNYGFPEVRHTYLHKVAWLAGGIGLFLGEMGALYLIPNVALRKALRILCILVLGYYVFFLFYSQYYNLGGFNHFDIVRFHSMFALLGIILPVHIYSLVAHQNQGAWYVFAGIATVATTVIFYNFQISFHQWFDFNDISHILEILCLVLICKGILWGYGKIREGQLARIGG